MFKNCDSRGVLRVLRALLLEMVVALVLCPLHGAPNGLEGWCVISTVSWPRIVKTLWRFSVVLAVVFV